MLQTIDRPGAGEYPDYYETYMSQLPEGDVLYLLEKQAADLRQMLQAIDDSRAEEAYAPGKWTMKELLQHMLDSERIFAYRALCISRGEEASLPGYDENKYASNSMANTRRLADMLEECELVRRANLVMFRSFTSEMLNNYGTANSKLISLRGAIYIVAAHEMHHMNLLRERYLKN